MRYRRAKKCQRLRAEAPRAQGALPSLTGGNNDCVNRKGGLGTIPASTKVGGGGGTVVKDGGNRRLTKEQAIKKKKQNAN